MNLTRTTLRLQKDLKRKAEFVALEKSTTLQAIINQALMDYLQNSAKKKAKKIVFKTHNLGVQLDNLKRKDFYSEPNFK